MLVYYFIVVYILLQTGVSILTEYSVRKSKMLKKPGKKSFCVRLCIYILLAIIPVLGAYLPNSSFKFLMMAIGNVWLGFFMYFTGLLLITVLITYIIVRVRKDDKKEIVGHALHISFILALAICVYGLIHAQNTKVVSYDVSVDKEVEGQKDLKVVLLGDLHLSVNSNLTMTKNMVKKINDTNPDLVVIAGDIFTSTYFGLKDPDKYANELSKIKTKYGVYVVCGNHDVEESLFGGFTISPVSEAFRVKEMEEFFDKAGFNVLYDESEELLDGKITLVGRIDGERAGDGTDERMSAAEVLKDVDKDKPVIVLQHEPMEFKELSENGADVALCGHTHAGQVFPGNLIVPFFNENAYGLKTIHGLETVVTAGVGYYGPPMRIGTDSEITVVNMKFK